MNARRLHRGAMSALVVLVAYWVISGLLLATYDYTDARQAWAIEGSGAGARLHVGTVLPPLHALRSGIDRAIARAADIPVASIRIYMAGPQPRIEFATADGRRDAMRRFDAGGSPVTEYFEPAAVEGSHAARRESLKAWHKGNAGGLAGQALGILAGFALLLLAGSGLWLFSQIWRARARTGRRSPFWNAGSGWQRLHRTVAIVAAAFILNIAFTGVVLGIGELQLRLFLDHQIGSPPYPRPGRMPPESENTLQFDLSRLPDRLEALAGGAVLREIEVVNRRGVEQVRMTGGAVPFTWILDLASGKALGPAIAEERQAGNGYFADWHQVVKRLHRGDIIGHFNGRALDIAAGVALLYLLLSGLVMFLAQRRGPRTT